MDKLQNIWKSEQHKSLIERQLTKKGFKVIGEYDL
jgi:hypothetical protein